MRSSKSRTMPSNHWQNNCTSCGRPARGHIGLQGRNCNMTDTPVVGQEKTEQANFDEVSYTGSKKDAVLIELTNQIGKLSLSIQQMQTD
jgi:hypothetical protein